MMRNSLALRKVFVPLMVVLLFVSLSSFNSAKNNFLFSSSVIVDEVLLAVNPFSYDLETTVSYYEEKINVFDSLDLDSKGLDFEAFDAALKGLEKLVMAGEIVKPGIMTIADFSKPSTEKRLYVIDLENYQVLFNTYVSHGRNSGKVLAEKFSNRLSSYQSSLGFFRTAETYRGVHGYSLKLDGLEKGINDNARNRAIVVHGADYVNPKLIRKQGYIGRSQGCPAVSTREARQIIDNIKDGSLFFIYNPSEEYMAQSSILN